MKISTVFEMYIQNYLTIKGYCKTQIDGYRRTELMLVGYLGDIDIEDVTVEDICRFLVSMSHQKRISQNTTGLYTTKVRQVLKWARRAGYNVIDYEMIPMPKRIPTIPRFLTEEEVSYLIKYANGVRGKLILSMLYGSGLRISELCSLNRDSIQDGCFSVVGKGAKMRLCFIDARSKRLLDQYLDSRKDSNEALIITHLGTRLTPVAIQEVVRGAVKRAGLENRHITPHTLRHSFATNFLENNGNLRYLQELLGHANLQTTQIYTHVVDSGLKDAYLRYHTC